MASPLVTLRSHTPVLAGPSMPSSQRGSQMGGPSLLLQYFLFSPRTSVSAYEADPTRHVHRTHAVGRRLSGSGEGAAAVHGGEDAASLRIRYALVVIQPTCLYPSQT
ncbi:hypothetical protein FPV67DRAFT_1674237 [Lyophyllum atratum]|nr:hypothetical protein FPV67DRAFT_1674237 [Lyophyllum atratum]